MADPLTELFGRRTFRGTGRADDYFPEAPDLSYLGRPSFVPRGANYNQNLDPAGAIAAGFSPRNAQLLQGFRQQLHQGAEQERFMRDEDEAFNALQKLDPASRNFSTQLLDIFRKNPRAQQSPEILGQVDFLTRFAPKTPQFSVEDIEDPDVYDLAVKENWSNLSPTEAKRRANKVVMQRTMRGELASLGLPQKELDREWTQEDFFREKGRLLRESKKKSVEPWTQRLSDKEREAVRMEVQTAMAPEDFETEFNDVLEKNPGLTKDAYVKQFKGDPDYASYQLRRAMESGAPQKLMREYGLNQNEVASLFGVSIPEQSSESTPAKVWPSEAPTTFGAPQTTATPQNAPAAIPVPNAAVPVEQPPQGSPDPARQDTSLNFPTLDEDFSPNQLQMAAKAIKTGLGNVAANVKFSPLDAIARAGQKGGIGDLATSSPPTPQQQNKAWTDAKEKVRAYLDHLPGDDQKKIKILGSIAKDRPVPMDFFTEKKSPDGKVPWISAASAFEDGMREIIPELGRQALTDAEGVKDWRDIIRVVASEEMVKRGFARQENQPTEGASPTGRKVVIGQPRKVQ